LGRHIDIKHGLAELGPLDRAGVREITVGVVGTAAGRDALVHWLEAAGHGVPAKAGKLPNLFPGFPGFNESSPFATRLVVDSRRSAELPLRALEGVRLSDDPARAGAALFVEAIGQILDRGRPDVFICALPPELLDLTDEPAEAGLSDSGDNPTGQQNPETQLGRTDLRDYLKAAALSAGVPLQLIRPETYGLSSPRRRTTLPRRLQDPATRAWNFFVAVYYKANGTPWRLVRHEEDLAACYVGVAFYRSSDAETVQTAMAQVFNERGQGMVIRGGPARFDKDDRVPHLDAQGAHDLLASALQRYRAEHLTMPARVLLHKTSFHDAAELAGFRSAADEAGIGVLDLLSIGSSPVRLFRPKPYPVLRGTTLLMGDDRILVYTRGSVTFFETYPGMYVPRPVLLRAGHADTPLAALARETLALTKMNWNNTQFDGATPITMRAAQEVGRILRYLPSGADIQSNYAYYM
jgi:hypothetical protein